MQMCDITKHKIFVSLNIFLSEKPERNIDFALCITQENCPVVSCIKTSWDMFFVECRDPNFNV